MPVAEANVSAGMQHTRTSDADESNMRVVAWPHRSMCATLWWTADLWALIPGMSLTSVPKVDPYDGERETARRRDLQRVLGKPRSAFRMSSQRHYDLPPAKAGRGYPSSG